MQAKKIINNNAVYSTDELGREIIVVGKGVGFQKKTGETLDTQKIEKIFRFTPERNSQFAELVNSMPYEYVQLAEEIVVYAATSLQTHLNKNIYITLTDHLNFAIERQKQGIYFQNALLWEIKKFYELEFSVGLKALELVQTRTGISLPEDEAGFFALHIVNAEMDGDLRQVSNIPTILKGALNIVRYHFRIELDEDSLSYERFVTHLKFLIQRVIQNKPYDDQDELSRSLWHHLWEEYPAAYECAKKIQAYIHQRIQAMDSDAELAYLTIHIERVVRSSKAGTPSQS